MKTILLKFSGPMQSWGTDSHFETRHTDHHPSKSAVLGLLAASLGWRRDDDRIADLNRFCFAVRVDQPGSMLKDYHTAHKPEVKNGGIISYRTYVTTRYYLQDAVFIVALGVSESSDMDKIVKALRSPYFQPYMGRRALPLPMDFLLDVVEGDPLSVLCSFPWQASRLVQKQEQRKGVGSKRLSIFTETPVRRSVSKPRRDHVLSLSASGRHYLARMEQETVCEIGINETHQEHNAFDALGGV